MATNEEEPGGQGPAAADPNAPTPDPAPEPQAQAEAEGAPEAPTIEQLAERIGWVPKDRYTGPEAAWKPADQFILDGREIQRDTARELRELRGTVDTMVKTSSTIVQQQVEQRLKELGAQYTEAVEEGDAKRSFELATEINTLKSGPPNGAAAIPPESQAWVEKNAAWFKKDPLATDVALQTTERLARQGYDVRTQLAEAERAVRKQFPELFPDQRNGKPAPGVHSPGSRGAGPSNRAKGFSDLPPAAQKVAQDMAKRGVIPNVEAYTKNYFANLDRKA